MKTINRLRLKWMLGTAMAASLFVTLGQAEPGVALAKAEAKPEARYAKAEAKPEAFA
ncbi:hypothetical protein ACFPES_14635 [Paenibacillus sp. GCM10023248]|uniref:hypothetical protein n=1 Tax=unclassified Paenibacillus TaxID=185978 RepID=UPI002378B5DC|nr:hypothetical protein [Paenibacillus sp. MAHUQ-63]MDD9268273.1 hypothetical protein [Paenibacillus sp. MAHUQ-63]